VGRQGRHCVPLDTVTSNSLIVPAWRTIMTTTTTTSTRNCHRRSCGCGHWRRFPYREGYVDPAALDILIETYEKKVGPRNGARVVAKAWSDPEYRNWLLKDANPAVAAVGYAGRQGEHLVVLENTPARHNMVVCTLCSCLSVAGARAAAGLVQVGTVPFARSCRSARRAARLRRGTSRRHRDPRLWDSTSEVRYLVLPMRPAEPTAGARSSLRSLSPATA